MAWYVTLYTVIGNEYTLETYETYKDFATAQQALWRATPDHPTQRYELEFKVGILATKRPNTKPPQREKYTVNNKVKKAFQVDADHAINGIVRRIRALRPNSDIKTIQAIVTDIQFYNNVWTKAQRSYLFEELAKQPCCTKLLYEYNAKHTAGYYI